MFLNSLKSNFYKSFKFKIILVHIVVAILGSSFMAYMLNFSTVLNNYQKVLSYIDVLSVSFPFFTSIVIAMNYTKERQANFTMMLKNNKYLNHLANITSLLIQGFIASIVANLVFYYLAKTLGFYNFGLKNYLNLSLILLMVNLFIYPATYMINYYFGNGASIFFNSTWIFVSGILLNGMGDNIWYLFPLSIGPRLSAYYSFSKISPNSIYSFPNAKIGIYVAIALIILINILFFYWSKSFEGNRIYSE